MKSLPSQQAYTISGRYLKIFAFFLEGEDNKNCCVLSVLNLRFLIWWYLETSVKAQSPVELSAFQIGDNKWI